MNDHLPIAVLAKKTADTRRVLMTMFGTELGVRVSLDLMGLYNPSPQQVAFSSVIAKAHRDTLARSNLFLADDDMVDLLDAAGPTMPDQELQPTDIIVPNGFVFFAKPLPDRSGIAPEIPIHALSWAYLPEGHPLLVERGATDSVLITSYVSVRDQFEARGMLRPGTEIAPGTPKFLPNATVMWTVGTLIGQAFGEVPPPGGYTPGFYQRALAAFWTLSQQPKVTTTTDQPPGKPTDQRRYKRAGIENPSEPVHVIRIHHRPTEAGGAVRGEATGRKVTVRSLVRGFWRNQWYPSIKSHRHIWIDPHWRGPENAPVQGGERVFLAHGTKTEKPEAPKV